MIGDRLIVTVIRLSRRIPFAPLLCSRSCSWRSPERRRPRTTHPLAAVSPPSSAPGLASRRAPRCRRSFGSTAFPTHSWSTAPAATGRSSRIGPRRRIRDGRRDGDWSPATRWSCGGPLASSGSASSYRRPATHFAGAPSPLATRTTFRRDRHGTRRPPWWRCHVRRFGHAAPPLLRRLPPASRRARPHGEHRFAQWILAPSCIPLRHRTRACDHCPRGATGARQPRGRLERPARAQRDRRAAGQQRRRRRPVMAANIAVGIGALYVDDKIFVNYTLPAFKELGRP